MMVKCAAVYVRLLAYSLDTDFVQRLLPHQLNKGIAKYHFGDANASVGIFFHFFLL